VIERTFAWACINRRPARDVERAATTARALFQIAMIKLMSRRTPQGHLSFQALTVHDPTSVDARRS
jgi:hypothetical protein